MSTVYEIIFHKELNMIHCFCGFMGMYHHCTRKIKGTITISKCLDDCKVCEKDVDRKEYNSIRWTTDFDGYAVCGSCYNKLSIDPICTGCFCKSCYSFLSKNCACFKD